MNNQECKIRPQIVKINRNEPLLYYPYNVKINKCSGNGNNIDGPKVKLWSPDVVKNINVKVFNLISKRNETRHIKWHKTCKCKCRLDASIFNNEQRWDNDKCRC